MRNDGLSDRGGGRSGGAGPEEGKADALARCAADPGHDWWRRRECLRALAGRVPQARVPELVDRLRDPGEVTEVRVALLEVLADRAELLPWLRQAGSAHDLGDRLERLWSACLRARGRLGDLSAAGDLTRLAADPWRHRRLVGEEGLDGLVAAHGVQAVLREVGDARPEDRLFRVRVRHSAGEDVTDALADPDRRVAHLAESLVTDPDRLRRYLEESPATEAALWAVLALHRLTGDTAQTRALHDRMGRPRVEVPGLDEEIRRAVVHRFAPGCQPLSDPRWRVEALCSDPPGGPGQDARLARASAALTAAGLAPRPPRFCAEECHGQGHGTYHVISYGDDGAQDGSQDGAQDGVPEEGGVLVSTLGPFVQGHRAGPAARRALEAAGFRWIDETTGSLVVSDLCVYHFGDRDPLSVSRLLFYWQD